jgi:hypothetical protein
MASAALEKRWQNRIVINGWHKLGSVGAEKYLAKYGKNIGGTKLKDLRDIAKEKGYADMATGFQAAFDALGTANSLIKKAPNTVKTLRKTLSELWKKENNEYHTDTTKLALLKKEVLNGIPRNDMKINPKCKTEVLLKIPFSKKESWISPKEFEFDDSGNRWVWNKGKSTIVILER